MKLNVELYPTSANTYDSLAEAYMANGDRELAIRFYNKALELLPADPTLSEQARERFKQHALEMLKKLELRE